MDSKMTIIIKADENGCSLSAPMDTQMDRLAVIDLLKAAIDIAKNFKGGGLVIANDMLFTPLTSGRLNIQANKKF